MSQDDITSGDLLYHTDDFNFHLLFSSVKDYKVSKKLLPNTQHNDSSDQNAIIIKSIEELLNYENTEKKLYQHKNKIQTYLLLRNMIRKLYEQKLQYFSRKLIKTINFHKLNYLMTAGKETTNLHNRLLANFHSFQSVLLTSSLQYFHILRKDLSSAKEKLLVERYEKELLKKQALLLKNISIFNIHLALETKRSIELTLLSKNTQQFLRCMKAVYDNLGNQNHLQIYHPDIYNLHTESLKTPSEMNNHSFSFPQQQFSADASEAEKNIIYHTLVNKDLKVNNIWKLKNHYLSSDLQVLCFLLSCFVLQIIVFSLFNRKFPRKSRTQR
jgi:hypothetical protein